jgi:hypothetical protein
MTPLTMIFRNNKGINTVKKFALLLFVFHGYQAVNSVISVFHLTIVKSWLSSHAYFPRLEYGTSCTELCCHGNVRRKFILLKEVKY